MSKNNLDTMTAAEFRELYAKGKLRISSEHDQQVSLFQWAASQRRRHPELAWLYAVPNGGHRGLGQEKFIIGAKLKAEGLRAGVWDVALDVARGGYFGLKLEMKHGKGQLTPEQNLWHAHYLTQGYYCIVATSWEEAAGEVLRYLQQPPTKRETT